ncbi:MAG: sigma-54-dependent Fis family transcriptional regulator, partial [Verrucomicrobia bacterium]|nr:sigma-54-dependent Fis family transcriptional regulator [Verrucomicrobiota bacterium]NDE96876.1 sigma-54-dependent Fis family transcriptional regulator [Verrucomicrobiota bacterium]
AATIMPADLPPGFAVARPSPVNPPSPSGVATHEPANEPANDVAVMARTLFTWARANSKLKVLPAVERELVICALAETQGNQVQAAKLLGITRATLRKRIEKFGIQRELSIR